MAHQFRFLAQRRGFQQWQLDREEWHHLFKVLRLPIGQDLELADGQGWVARAQLIGKQQQAECLLILEEIWQPPLLASSQLILAIAALKPQSVDDLLPYLIELGVEGIEIFSYQNMDKSRLQDKVRERWQRIVTTAIKQCKRAWTPEIAWSESFEEFVQKSQSWPNRVFLDPAGEHRLSDWRPAIAGPTVAVIGGEKGLSRSEILNLREHGFQACRIDAGILRATTAAIATAAILRQSSPVELHKEC